jgi:hypothetical protein
MAKLKVFRTSIGFHDAYVAAASQKAALAAWGAEADLFARGMAERVTDPKLAAEPLEKPGQVIRRPRGTAAEHIAALPREPRAPAEATSGKTVSMSGHLDTLSKPSPSPPSKRRPRPSRAKLDTLENEMDALEACQRRELREVAAEEARLERRKAAIGRSHEHERSALQRKLDRAKSNHQRAMQLWRSQF